MMASTRKKILLLFLKYSGGFWLARRLTAKGLRILCYHGLALEDEHEFRGRLFMQPQTFRARMECLKRLGHPVLPLAEALTALRNDSLPPATVALTFDDGWEGACRVAFPLLRELGFPVTLYAATHYAEKGTQVLNVTVQYLFWKTRIRELILPGILPDDGPRDLSNSEQRERTMNQIIRHGRALASAQQCQVLLRRLGEALEIDVPALERKGVLRFGTLDTLRELDRAGIDLQLHTHRHNLFAGDERTVTQEISDNRAILAPLTNRPLVHFCYPGGIYRKSMWPTLEKLGIDSATTCESGFNYASTPRLGLRRILDEEGLSLLEFEAELSGVLELWKRARAGITGLRGRVKTAHE